MIALHRLPAAGLVALACALVPAAAQDRETVDRLLSEAAQLERDGDREAALATYELLSDQFPEAPAAAEALLRQILGNRELGRDDDAETAARALIESHPRSMQAAGAYTLLGQLEAERAQGPEDLDEARKALENAVLLFPRAGYAEQPWRAEAAVRGALVALRQGRDAEAARALADVIDLERRSRWTLAARLELAGLLLDQGDWLEAGDLLQAIVDGAGDNEEERALAGLAASRLGLVHRLGLRPETGEDRWQTARLVSGAPEKPTAVAARPDGHVAVTPGKGSTAVLDADGRVVKRWPHGEARRNSWAGTDLVVATEEVAATFAEAPGRDNRSLRFAAPPSEKKPTIRRLVAVEPAPFGGWLVLAAKPVRVMLYESGRRLHEALLAGKSHEPVDLARDRRGRLLVLDQKARTVTRFTAGDNRGEKVVSGSWDRAEALAVDPAGNLYVLDQGKRRIEIYGRDGSRVTAVGPTLPGGLELERPSDLTVDGAGRIWVADTRLGLIVLE